MRFVVARRSPQFPVNCSDPGQMALSYLDREVPTVVICSNNSYYLESAIDAFIQSQNFNRKFFNGDMLGAYLFSQANVYQLNRSNMFSTDHPLRTGCSLKYFIFRQSMQFGLVSCSDVTPSVEAGDLNYKTWLSSRRGLVDPRITRFLRDQQKQYPGALSQPLGDIEDSPATRAVNVLMLYAIAHELGHISLGHLERDIVDRCVLLQQEEAADQFAEQRLLQTGLISNVNDIRLLLPISMFYSFLSESTNNWSEDGIYETRLRLSLLAMIAKMRESVADEQYAQLRPVVDQLASLFEPMVQEEFADNSCNGQAK